MAPAPISPTEARVSDPVLTQAARGYRNEALIHRSLFPIVPVGTRGGKVVEFRADSFRELDTERAPGGARQEVEIGYKGVDYALRQHALDGVVPIEMQEEAAAQPGIDMQMAVMRTVTDVVGLNIERDAAALATAVGSYDASNKLAIGAADDKWSAADSDPLKNVETARAQIRKGIGRNPNVMVVSEEVHEALRKHPKIIEQVKYTKGLQDAGAGMMIVGEREIAAYFGIDRYVVGRAMKGEAGAFSSVWGKNAVIAYSNVTPLASMGSPSFGYTYQLRGYPRAGAGYYDAKRDSWLYPYTEESTPVIAGKAAGYLISAVIA